MTHQSMNEWLAEPVTVTLSRREWADVEEILERQANRDQGSRNFKVRGRRLRQAAHAIHEARRTGNWEWAR